MIEKERQEAFLGSLYDDEDVLPALHLFHHYIELSFKSLLGKIGKNLPTHDLRKLLGEIEKAYPNFKLSKLPRLLITDNDLINENRYFLELEGFRYPTDNKGNKIWTIEDARGSFIMLDGVYNSSIRLISEVEDFFKKEIFSLKD